MNEESSYLSQSEESYCSDYDDQSYAATQRQGSQDDDADIIAIFGAGGPTGSRMVRLALDAGYRVQALMLPGHKLKDSHLCDDPHFTAVAGSLVDHIAIKETIFGATYIVCMLSDVFSKQNNAYKKDSLASFVSILYPLMQEERKLKVFLYQATSLAADIRGKTPILSKVMKKATASQSLFLQDQDAVAKFIGLQHSQPSKRRANTKRFAFIFTRPSVLMKDTASRHTLYASKSQPGPFSSSCADVAEFSLNALQNTKLFCTCPYLVP